MQVGAIDIGGTSIKYAVINASGRILFHDSVPTEASLGGLEVMNKILHLCMELKVKFNVDGFTVSSAGQIDSEKGEVIYATETIPGYTGMPIARIIREHVKLPVVVENDVNCAALGEHWKGAAKGVSNFICMALGTGIGGALFLNGKLYTGSNYSAGEIGHINLYPNGKKCSCGNNGCYEQYASSSALERLAADGLGHSIDLKAFFEKLKKGDLTCRYIYSKWIDDLTTGMQAIIHLFNPELILIGGGISAQGDFLLQSIKTSLSEKVMPNHRNTVEVKIAENLNNANLLGAVHRYLMKI